ncbi:MAG: SlyX protein [Geminicoccus sp.]|nr:SlyX protein [Geminicoccus sp.]
MANRMHISPPRAENPMTNAIVEMEIRLEHQEATLTDLSDVVAQQQGQIDRLVAEVNRLRLRLEQDTAAIPSSAEETLPPHY